MVDVYRRALWACPFFGHALLQPKLGQLIAELEEVEVHGQVRNGRGASEKLIMAVRHHHTTDYNDGQESNQASHSE